MSSKISTWFVTLSKKISSILCIRKMFALTQPHRKKKLGRITFVVYDHDCGDDGDDVDGDFHFFLFFVSLVFVDVF